MIDYNTTKSLFEEANEFLTEAASKKKPAARKKTKEEEYHQKMADHIFNNYMSHEGDDDEYSPHAAIFSALHDLHQAAARAHAQGHPMAHQVSDVANSMHERLFGMGHSLKAPQP